MRFRKRANLFIILSLLGTALLGCGQVVNDTKEAAGSQSDIRTVHHALGETPIEGHPQRIVVLELGPIDTLLSLGMKPVGVADDQKPNLIDPEVRKAIEGYQSVGTRAQPNLEVIQTLKPDLIIADADRHKNVYAELTAISPTVAVKSLNGTYQDVLDSVTLIGDAVGKKNEAEKLLQTHRAKVEGIKQKVKGNPTILLTAERDKTFNVRTLQFYTPGLLEAVGYTYGLKKKTEEYSVTMTIEQIVETDPDILILMKTVDGKSSIPSWANDPLWKSLKAVKNHQVYEVDVTLWSLRRSLEGADKILNETEKLILSSN